MAQSKQTLTCSCDEQLAERVDEYADRAGYEHRSPALQELIRTGLRETRAPLLTRFREQAINYANFMAIFALVFLAGGIVTKEIAFTTGLRMSLVLVLGAIGIVAFLEVIRLFNGQSELGETVHRWFA